MVQRGIAVFPTHKQVRIVGLFPEGSHQPISYPIALTTAGNAGAAAFLEFLRGPTGAARFEKFGFTVLH